MSSPAEEKWRAALPKADFFVKSIEVMASFDRLMVTLFSTLIAGIVALLIQENVTFWISAPLVLAGACFGIGLFHTLLHISSMSKMLLLAEWLANGTEVVPQALNIEDHTFPALLRTQAYAQRAFASQLVHLLLGTFFAAIGAVVHLWEYSWRGGIVALLVLVLLFVIASLILTWRQTLRQFHSRSMASAEEELPHTTHRS